MNNYSKILDTLRKSSIILTVYDFHMITGLNERDIVSALNAIGMDFNLTVGCDGGIYTYCLEDDTILPDYMEMIDNLGDIILKAIEVRGMTLNQIYSTVKSKYNIVNYYVVLNNMKNTRLVYEKNNRFYLTPEGRKYLG